MEKETQDFNFNNSFALSLEDFFVSCKSEPSSSPKLLKLNNNLVPNTTKSRLLKFQRRFD